MHLIRPQKYTRYYFQNLSPNLKQAGSEIEELFISNGIIDPHGKEYRPRIILLRKKEIHSHSLCYQSRNSTGHHYCWLQKWSKLIV